jgi:hypothetical protein
MTIVIFTNPYPLSYPLGATPANLSLPQHRIFDSLKA